MLKRTALQMLALVAAASLAGLVSNAVRGKLEWGGNDPQLLKHKLASVSLDEAARELTDPATLFLDVRPPAEFAAGHIPGAVSFPAEKLEEAYAELRDFLGPEQAVVVYGQETLPAVRAAQFLEARGHAVRVLEGGWRAWRERGRPIEGESAP